MLSFTKCGWNTQTTPEFIDRINNCKTFYLHHSIFHRIAPYTTEALKAHNLVMVKHDWYKDPYIYLHVPAKHLAGLNISRVSINEKEVTSLSCGRYTGDLEMFMNNDIDVSWINSNGFKFELAKHPDSGHDVIYVMGQSWYNEQSY